MVFLRSSLASLSRAATRVARRREAASTQFRSSFRTQSRQHTTPDHLSPKPQRRYLSKSPPSLQRSHTSHPFSIQIGARSTIEGYDAPPTQTGNSLRRLSSSRQPAHARLAAGRRRYVTTLDLLNLMQGHFSLFITFLFVHAHLLFR